MSTLRIRFGSIELDYEGELAFEKADIFGLLDTVSKLTPPAESAPPNNFVDMRQSGNGVANGGGTDMSTWSVSDIAQRLGVTSGPDLIKAAAATLHFKSKKVEFTNKELTAAMRDAKAYFKQSYASNLGQSLARLVKNDELRSLGGDRYALSHKSIQELNTRLAQA